MDSSISTNTIDAGTRIGPVHLTISELDRSLSFYTDRLGMSVRERDARSAVVGVEGSDLLVLSQSDRASRVPGTAGLYHFAVLVPSRLELARSLRRLVERGTPIQGAADHGVSEALYLADPDGNGIEIYRDRPRGEWPMTGGRLRMGVDPLDVDSLLTESSEGPVTSQLAPDTSMGHVHLHVSNLADAEAFYAGVLGFSVMQRYGDSALFLSAGGYHHHIGVNTWAGVGAPPAPAGSIGLRHFIIRLPHEAELARVSRRLRDAGVATTALEDGVLARDPSGNAILLANG